MVEIINGFIATLVALAVSTLAPAAPAEDYVDEYDGGYYEETYYYYEPTYYGGGYDHEFKRMGVIETDDATYTWYSQRVLPGGGLTELNENGRTVDDEGFIRDGDGYIAVASSDYEVGTVVDTPFGEGKVYDGGCDSGVIDVYTDW